jgi:hypothetical protein
MRITARRQAAGKQISMRSPGHEVGPMRFRPIVVCVGLVLTPGLVLTAHAQYEVTRAMLLAGFGGLGFVSYRRAHKGNAAAV